MRALPMIGALVVLAGCGPDTVETDDDARCAVFTELLVLEDDSGPPWPASTHGDEALELWLSDRRGGWDGFMPQPDGSYAPAWRFEMPELAGFLDFDGDGLDDPYSGPRRGESGAWTYRRMGPDGVPEAAEIDLGVDPIGETVELWADFDGDRRPDRITRIESELWIVASGARTRIHDGADGASFVQRVRGDSQMIALWVDTGASLAGTLLRVGAGGTVEPVFGPHDLGGREPALVHALDAWIDVYTTTPHLPGEDYDLFRSRTDRETGEVRDEVLERGIRGRFSSDFDGDGHLDLAVSDSPPTMEFRFGDAAGDFGPRQPIPDSVDWENSGANPTFDLDQDGAIEVLLAEPIEEGRVRLRSMQFERCG